MILIIIKILFLLGFLIILHEFAHFIVARLCGVKVNEFSIGFGKKIFQKETKNTIYTLRLIPLGGYVNLKGLDEKSDDIDSYTNINVFKRMAVILAGGIANILFGLLVYFILIASITTFQNAMISTGNFAVSLVENIKILFTGGVSVDQLMGPIGISSIVSDTHGLIEFMYLLAIVSMSLGITNLLPIPPLDGFKFLLLLIEAVRRKPFTEKFEHTTQFIGFFLLLVLSVYVAYNDVVRLF